MGKYRRFARLTAKWMAVVLFLCLFAETARVHAERMPAPEDEQEFGLFSLQAVEEPTIEVQDVTEGLTVTDLVYEMMGAGVTVTSITYSGDPRAFGRFSGGADIVGLDRGIVLGSGCASGISGSNDSDSFSCSHGRQGDSDLDALVDSVENSHDAAVIEFEFIPSSSSISFQYVLGSEEYPEYIIDDPNSGQYGGSEFNDTFGFFVNGENIAWVPETQNTVAVSIANVNHIRRSEFYVDNREPALYPTQMDGFTKVFNANAEVVPGEVNHMKIAIQDVGDDSYDSNILIKSTSLDTGEAEPGVFALGEILSEVDPERNVQVTEITVVRENGSDGSVQVSWRASHSTDEGAEQVQNGTVSFNDAQTSALFVTEFPLDAVSASVELTAVNAEAGLDPDRRDAPVELIPFSIRTPAGGFVIMEPGGQLSLTAGYGDTTDPTVTWAVYDGQLNPTDVAEIDENGVLRALRDGSVTVMAADREHPQNRDTREIVISGQVYRLNVTLQSEVPVDWAGMEITARSADRPDEVRIGYADAGGKVSFDDLTFGEWIVYLSYSGTEPFPYEVHSPRVAVRVGSGSGAVIEAVLGVWRLDRNQDGIVDLPDIIRLRKDMEAIMGTPAVTGWQPNFAEWLKAITPRFIDPWPQFET